MAHYIDKDALVAEIERRYETNIIGAHNAFRNGKIEALREVKDFIDTLEVKEVDNVWHDASEKPTMFRKYLVRFSDGGVSGSWERHDDGFIPWKHVVKEHAFTHWCYVEDLLKL